MVLSSSMALAAADGRVGQDAILEDNVHATVQIVAWHSLHHHVTVSGCSRSSWPCMASRCPKSPRKALSAVATNSGVSSCIWTAVITRRSTVHMRIVGLSEHIPLFALAEAMLYLTPQQPQ